MAFLGSMMFFGVNTAKAEEEPKAKNYSGVGEDGTQLCFCNTSGTGCLCL